MIYLDNAATTWPKPEAVYQAVDACLRSVGGNPGRGGHGSARTATGILYEAREELATLFGIANPTEIIFTHNATDALNMAVLGTIGPGDIIVSTSMEHNAVARPLRHLERSGATLRIVDCNLDGMPDLTLLKQAAKGAKAIVMSHASNVTGTIMPVYEAGQIAKANHCLFIVDAAQTAGVEEIDIRNMNIDMLAFSGHKGLFGPQGTGGLYIRDGIQIMPLRYGGTGSLSESDVQPEFLPDRLESGTPNTPGIAGLLAGVRYIQAVGRETIRSKESKLASQLKEGLKAIKGVAIYGPADNNKQTAVVSFTIAGLDSGAIAHELDRKFGIACRAGLHCAPWTHQTIGTLKTGTVRFSPGYFNTSGEITEAIQAVKSIAKRDGEK